jgi:flagellar biogenesis protein FliO
LPKWLFLPPAVALLMVLGPMSMQGAPANEAAPAAQPTPAAVSAEAPPTATEKVLGRTAPMVPRTPDLWQMGSALAAVLLLGTAGVMLLRKLRGGATPMRGSTPLVTLRQTLRLSARQAVHAIEFDDRILLIGEHERGLVLLESGRTIDRSDEGEVLAREAEPEVVEDGAVPKNLVIPRPPRPAGRPLPARHPAPAAARNPGLNDFRALLQKVGRA